MKKTFKVMFACLTAVIAFSGCKKDKELNHTKVSEVKNLYGPADNASIFVEGEGSAVFEWEAARAEDNGVVLYEVLFDKLDGDFSKPLYSVPSDGKGYQRILTLSYSDLIKVAKAAGITSASSGKVKWTVWSSKGINVQQSTVSRTLEIQRPEGIEAPSSVFLTGTATEGGTDISKALPFKKVEEGVFEIYTSLKSGTYSFSARNSDDAPKYSINSESKLAEGGESTYSGADKVYRIKINFTSLVTEMTEIESVGLWFAPENKIWFELPYTGGGNWEIKNAPIVFRQESWGRDERYKFRFKVKKADGAAAEEWYGSTKGDNQRPTASTEPAYWFMVPVSGNQWDNCFKFNGNADNKNADIKVSYTPAAYTHTVTVK